MSGVLVLFWPALQNGQIESARRTVGSDFQSVLGELQLAGALPEPVKIAGVEVAAHSMWMSGVWLLPVGLIELARTGGFGRAASGRAGVLRILFGGVVPYALWNSALRHWRTSQVMLFNNFIPLSTTTWAYYTLGEPITSTFCAAMILIIAAVALGQADWAKIFKLPESF